MKKEIAWMLVVLGGIGCLILGPSMGYALFNNTAGFLLGICAGVLMVCGLVYIFERIEWL